MVDTTKKQSRPFLEMLSGFLYMNWLRPEVVIWDTVASQLIGSELIKSSNIMEIGIGNGCFTFMACGGRFKKEYDWYYNVDTAGFWKNRDIYDAFTCCDIAEYIASPSPIRIKLALDHKENLLKQAAQLGFIDNLHVVDANDDFDFSGIDTVYSNILYWLKDPLQVLRNLDKRLSSGAKAIIVFPNSDFYKNCSSYSRSTELLKLLNRGRGDTLMWTMNMDQFSKVISKTGFVINHYVKFLAPSTLKIWDIGLRPLSPHLIKMANGLSPELRSEIKMEWCETCMRFLDEMAELELSEGPDRGGYNFVVLSKIT